MSYSNRLPLTEDSCYEIVHLELTREIDHGIFDDDLAHIIPWCPNLQSVHVSGFLDLTDRTVVLLATYASKLRRLDISGCRGVTDVGVLEVASTLMGLEVLKLSGLSTLMDPAVSAITRSLPRLQELEMNDLPLITAVSVRDIWTFCRKLRRLKLAHCPQLNDRAFPYAPHSKSSPGVASIRSSAQAARDVRLSASSRRSRPPTWLDSLPPLILTPGHTLPDLRLLDLSHCSKLTDAAIAGVIAHAPSIQHLTLSGCTGLTDAAMHAVAKLGVHLDVLALTRVEKLTDAGIVALVRGCPRLKSVEVSFNRRLRDLSLLELASLPQLRRLAAVGLPRVTDVALLFLAEHAGALARLHLSQCKRLSLGAVHVAVRRLAALEHLSASGVPALEHLSASGVPALERPGVERFSERAPEVRAALSPPFLPRSPSGPRPDVLTSAFAFLPAGLLPGCRATTSARRARSASSRASACARSRRSSTRSSRGGARRSAGTSSSCPARTTAPICTERERVPRAVLSAGFIRAVRACDVPSIAAYRAIA
ncbi:hypothetical protein AcW1_004979 [Taiwanofungus camphoratus]|nr:hypothetical protein AcW1_004979 [Antrodia cinnamomea]